MLWFVLAGMTGLAVLCALWPLAFRRKGGSDAASEVGFLQGPARRDRARRRARAIAGRGSRRGARRGGAAADRGERGGAGKSARRAKRVTARRIAAALILIVVPLGRARAFTPIWVGRTCPTRRSPAAWRTSRRADGVEAAIARIEAHLAASPDDGQGLGGDRAGLYAPGTLRRRGRRLWRDPAARGRKRGQRADYGEALVGAAGGVVTADARAAFDKALAEQPGLPAARFYLGLAAEQDGDKAKAIAIYQALLGETPAEAPWTGALQARLAAVKGEARAPRRRARRRPPHPLRTRVGRGGVGRRAAGADPRHGGAAGDAPGAERRRARTNGGASFAPMPVLREPDKASEALAAARKALAGDAGGGGRPRRAGAATGNRGRRRFIGAGRARRTPRPPARAGERGEPPPRRRLRAKRRPAGSDDAQQAMIRGMVERLATRLAQSGGDASQWGRLIRAYSVLHEPDKAQGGARRGAQGAGGRRGGGAPASTRWRANWALEADR